MLDPNNRVFVKHVKALFNPDLLHILRAKITEMAAKQTQSDVSDREKSALDRGESADKLRMHAAWYEVWEQPTSRSLLLETIAPFTYVIYPVQVRHVRQAYGHHVPWHQDIAYIRLLGNRSHYQVVTCFIPLESEPAKCTTIQFAFDNAQANHDLVYKHKPLEGFGAGIESVEFENVEHFDLNLGDALIFGDHTLHRTYLPENCQIERRSLEFRLICPQHAISDKDYFDIEQASFIRFDNVMQLTSTMIA